MIGVSRPRPRAVLPKPLYSIFDNAPMTLLATAALTFIAGLVVFLSINAEVPKLSIPGLDRPADVLSGTRDLYNRRDPRRRARRPTFVFFGLDSLRAAIFRMAGDHPWLALGLSVGFDTAASKTHRCRFCQDSCACCSLCGYGPLRCEIEKWCAVYSDAYLLTSLLAAGTDRT